MYTLRIHSELLISSCFKSVFCGDLDLSVDCGCVFMYVCYQDLAGSHVSAYDYSIVGYVYWHFSLEKCENTGASIGVFELWIFKLVC